MAHTGIFATSDEILVKAGANYSVLITEARINALCLQAEAYINTATRYNWSDKYASLNADVKGILADAESNFVSKFIVPFQTSGYTSLEAASLLIDVLWSSFDMDIAMLIKCRDYIESA